MTVPKTTVRCPDKRFRTRPDRQPSGGLTMTTDEERTADEIQGGCGGNSPDTWCGECADCLEGLDEWRELNGIEEA